jgi:hypothetical protein
MKIIISTLLLNILPFGAFAQRSESRPVELFRLTELPRQMEVAKASSIASKREAAILFESAAASRARFAQSLEISLFDGKTYTAERSDLETRGPGDLTWRGKLISGKFDGDVVLTFKNGFVAGLIYSPDAVYEIVPKGEQQILIELDQSLFPPCGGAITGDMTPTGKVLRAPEATIDSGDRLDVLVLYTASVRTSLGGDPQAQTFAQQAVDATNTAYINSRIRQRVRLLAAQVTAMNETGDFNTELSNLRANADAAIARDAVKADLVDMLTNSTAACGIGYLMGPVGGNQNNAFTVTSRTCAVGNLSFAHELGHNMASHHNPENGGTATYPYGYGHYVNGNYRTVMSYVDPCPAGCTRVAYFSNPYVIFNGFPTGIENARDNARSINNTADWIANYRYSGASLQLNVLNNAEMVARLIRRNITWTSDNLTGNVRIDFSRDQGTTWQTLVASTPNDGSELVPMPANPTRRARLRIVSLTNAAVSDSSVINFSIR